MEQNKHLASQNEPQPANLQGASFSYRRFFCENCGCTVDVCRPCDRQQVYCPECHGERTQARVKKAQKNYKKSFRGKRKRAAACMRRRARLKAKKEEGNRSAAEPSKIFEGDRGSSFSQVIATPPEPAILAEQEKKGVSDDVQLPDTILNSSMHQQQGTAGKTKKIVCSFCHRTCLPFQRQKTGRLGAKEKKDIARWLARPWNKDP